MTLCTLHGSAMLAPSQPIVSIYPVSSKFDASVQGVASNVQDSAERRKRSVMVAGAKAGRDK